MARQEIVVGALCQLERENSALGLPHERVHAGEACAVYVQYQEIKDNK